LSHFTSHSFVLLVGNLSQKGQLCIACKLSEYNVGYRSKRSDER
jgi:hypothetical protein